ncbi:MAG: Hsp20/alpha crystallin family protein [Opitutaceae bacterium]
MHTIIHPLSPARSLPSSEVSPVIQVNLRKPTYDCQDHPDSVKLTVYVPGVDAAGVEIEARAPDLIVTARKAHFVRVNWQALHLEGAQRDYQLRLRLGHGVDYTALQAEIHQGVLLVTLPKRLPTEDALPTRNVA